MLEPVTLHQTRFRIPGIAPDARGVVLGKMGVLLLPSLDRLVGFLAVLSDELSLDELLPTLTLAEVSGGLGSRELLVSFQPGSSYLMDRVVRLCRLFGGLAYVGTHRHFVKYRDPASPLGYDVAELAQESADHLLYGDNQVQAMHVVRSLSLARLVERLSLRALPGGSDRAASMSAEVGQGEEPIWLTIERGLAEHVIGYLWRNRVPVAAALLDSAPAPTHSFGQRSRLLLARVSHLPARMWRLFATLPGVALYRPVGENIAVEVGYRHPLRLESCLSLFDKERFYLFSGRRDAVEVLQGPVVLAGGERLLDVAFALPPLADTELGPGRMSPAPRIEVRLRLEPTREPPVRVTATLVAWSRTAWLKQLAHLLPPTVLSDYRLAAIDEGLLVVSAQGVDSLPIGDLLQEVAPSIYVPVGYQFLPRVSEAVLTEQVGGVVGRTVVFLRGGSSPIAIADESFEPLGRRIVARLHTELRSKKATAPSTASDARLQNDSAGVFPLWGFRADRSGRED